MLQRLPVLALLVLVAAGCKKEPYDTAPVSGRITINDKPYAKIAIMFQPVATDGSNTPGPGSYGITDDDGRFTLKLVDKDTKGAVVGKHRVWITNYSETDDVYDDTPKKRPPPAIRVPGRYSFMEGKMEFIVPPSGTDSADFKLTAP
jgi:hypothetical protein